ncbi:MAG: type II secretion system protein [Acidobacteriaceae bacterium]
MSNRVVMRFLLKTDPSVPRCGVSRQHERQRFALYPSEEGFMLLAAVVMVALLLIALSVAAPMVARQLQRDKEIESQHRMNEYVRAVQLYYRSFGNYPPSIKALENNNNIRFLRKVYIDPLTGKADYRLIHQGEQRTKIHVFFGQDLDEVTANLGSAAGMQAGGGGGMAPGGPPSATPTNGSGSGPGGSPTGSDMGGSSFGSSTNAGSGSGTSGSAGSSGSSATDSSSDDLDADSLGVIVGVGTSMSGTSITQPNGQTSYEDWEFWYDPKIDMLKQAVNVTGGSGISSQSSSSFGQDAITGQSNSGTNGGSSLFGGSSSGSSSGSSPFGSSGTNGANSNSPFSSSPF